MPPRKKSNKNKKNATALPTRDVQVNTLRQSVQDTIGAKNLLDNADKLDKAECDNLQKQYANKAEKLHIAVEEFQYTRSTDLQPQPSTPIQLDDNQSFQVWRLHQEVKLLLQRTNKEDRTNVDSEDRALTGQHGKIDQRILDDFAASFGLRTSSQTLENEYWLPQDFARLSVDRPVIATEEDASDSSTDESAPEIPGLLNLRTLKARLGGDMRESLGRSAQF